MRRKNREFDNCFGKKYDWLCFCWVSPNLQSPDKVKMINKFNGKAFLTYLIGATLLPLGVYAAKKVRDALA